MIVKNIETYNQNETEIGLNELIENSKIFHVKIFNQEPTLFSKGSTRIEFVGNFTDHGKSLNAIGGTPNLGIVAAVSKRKDRQIHLWSSIFPNEKPTVIDLDNLPLVKDTLHWSNHQISILNELFHQHSTIFNKLSGANFSLATNVPPGISIGTSTAAEASFFEGLLGVNKIILSSRQKIKVERQAELNIFPGCGYLDHVTSLTSVPFGYGIKLNFSDPGDGIPCITTPINININTHGYQWIIVYAENFPRNIVTTDFSRKVKKIKEGISLIQKQSGKLIHELTTKQATQYFLEIKNLDNETAGVINHILSENDRVLQTEKLFKQLLQAKPHTNQSKKIIIKIGKILNDCGQSSINHMGVSTGINRLPSFQPFLEQMHQAGAIGARNMGGGFTPTMLGLIEKTKTPEFIIDLHNRFHQLCPEVCLKIVPINPGQSSRVLS